MNLTFFETPGDFRNWLELNHEKETELIVGYYKKATKLRSITWEESRDEALCFGWIDGIRRRNDELSYSVRFTPRKPKSIWSKVNIARVNEMTQEGRMHPTGIAAFERRDEKKSGIYGFEQENLALPKAFEEKIKANPKAWDFFSNLAPSYKKMTIWYVIRAKQEATRERRLNILIECSEAGLKIPPIRR